MAGLLRVVLSRTRWAALLLLTAILIAAAWTSTSRADEDSPFPCEPFYAADYFEAEGYLFHEVPFIQDHPIGANLSYNVLDLHFPPPVTADRTHQLVAATETISCWRNSYNIPGLGWVDFIYHRQISSSGVVVWNSGECGEETIRLADGSQTGGWLAVGQLAYDCGPGEGGGGGGGGAGGPTCWWDYGLIEISYDGGVTWSTYWEGWYLACDDGSIYLIT
jgi:hypothetical protein